MPIPDTDQDITQTLSLLSRRHIVLRAVSGASALAVLTASGTLAVRHDDKDDNRDEGGQGDDSGHDERDEGDHGHDDTDDRDEGGQDDDSPASTSGVPTGSIEVQIVDDDEHGFSPGSVEIEIGQSITFVNLDNDAHTATSASWDTGIMQPGESVTITFDEAGSFAYSCQIHPVMTGTITVGDPAQASPVASPTSATPVAGGEGATVTIQDFAFGPQSVEIAVGTTVTWTNDDQAPHTATSLDGAFDTDTIEPGQSATLTFDTAGSFDYQCAFHPNMTGTVIVA